MEKVVYILGAGFSAPLGVPVMSNFILKAKDLYFLDVEKYAHFKEIFDLLDSMSVIKNFFKSDLYNIEEVLSILEMNDYINGTNNSENFKRFISDVVHFYTPSVSGRAEGLPGNWHDFIFGGNGLNQTLYGNFVGNLLGVTASMENTKRKIIWDPLYNNKVNYSVISFNYDKVLESFSKYMQESGITHSDFGFNKDDEILDSNKTLLLKIHGCVEKGNIVPPTWNKYSNPELMLTWQNAWKTIKNANHIRIIGYSLPLSDSYIKYFLKSAIYGSPHLKSIDVITLDRSPEQEVKKRYDEFIDFNYYRFKNANILEYFNLLREKQKVNGYSSTVTVDFNKLEEVHNIFMNKQ